jgi:SWI/SNF-related matrix-associated actin-dependent regulator 1 of chromatin subfamily A
MFTSFLNNLYEKLKGKAVILTGEQSQKEKQDAVDSIQQGKKKVLLANIIAGGTGWTLDKANVVIFTDISYTPIENEQARDRFIPTNPNLDYEPKQIIYLQTTNSIDKSIEKMVNNKINIIQFVNDYGLNAVVNYKEV